MKECAVAVVAVVAMVAVVAVAASKMARAPSFFFFFLSFFFFPFGGMPPEQPGQGQGRPATGCAAASSALTPWVQP